MTNYIDPSKPNPFEEGMQAIFEGLVLASVGDLGPEVIHTLVELKENSLVAMAVQGFTLTGMGAGDGYVTGMHGPLPVPYAQGMKALIYSFVMEAPNAKDHRITKHGKLMALFLVFKEDNLRPVMRASGLIESYLLLLLNKFDSEDEFTEEAMKNLNKQIIDLATRPRVRCFTVADNDIIEFFDERMVPTSANLVIVDERKKQMHVLLPGGLKPFAKRELFVRLHEFNSEFYKSGLKMVDHIELEEIEQKRLDYDIKMY